MKRKLKSRRGETLVESLCAVLIASLSAALLAGMVTAASNMNISARENDAKLYSSISDAETFAGDARTGEITVTVGSKTTDAAVQVYGQVVSSYRRSGE